MSRIDPNNEKQRRLIMMLVRQAGVGPRDVQGLGKLSIRRMGKLKGRYWPAYNKNDPRVALELLFHDRELAEPYIDISRRYSRGKSGKLTSEGRAILRHEIGHHVDFALRGVRGDKYFLGQSKLHRLPAAPMPPAERALRRIARKREDEIWPIYPTVRTPDDRYRLASPEETFADIYAMHRRARAAVQMLDPKFKRGLSAEQLREHRHVLALALNEYRKKHKVSR